MAVLKVKTDDGWVPVKTDAGNATDGNIVAYCYYDARTNEETSYNVSSIKLISAGKYEYSFDAPMNDASYTCVNAGTTSQAGQACWCFPGEKTANSVKVFALQGYNPIAYQNITTQDWMIIEKRES